MQGENEGKSEIICGKESLHAIGVGKGITSQASVVTQLCALIVTD
jgi:hypothetical protein